MSDGWAMCTLDAIERIQMADSGVAWVPVRAHLGIRSFGVNAWTGDAGSELIGPHDETDDFAGGHEELYLVLSGSATITVGPDEFDAAAGTLIFVGDRALTRCAVAREDGTAVLTIGGEPGAPFQLAAWEFLVRAGAYGRSGDLGRAIATIEAGIDACSPSAELLYHLACHESLAGRPESARAHLASAVDLDPTIRERADADPDLEPLRQRERT